MRAWSGYSDQKNYAAGLARNDWILSVDADERVSLALGDEIARTTWDSGSAAPTGGPTGSCGCTTGAPANGIACAYTNLCG